MYERRLSCIPREEIVVRKRIHKGCLDSCYEEVSEGQARDDSPHDPP